MEREVHELLTLTRDHIHDPAASLPVRYSNFVKSRWCPLCYTASGSRKILYFGI